MRSIRPLLYILIVIPAFFIASCKKVPVYEWIYSEKNNSISDLARNFKEPPAEFKPYTTVYWDSGITKFKIKLQLEDLANSGFGGIYIDFKSYTNDISIDSIYPDCYSYAVDLAKHLGIKVWLNASYTPDNGILGMFRQSTISAYINDTVSEGQALVQRKFNKLILDSITGCFLILKLHDKSYEDISYNYTNELRKKGVYYAYKLIKFPAFYLPSKDTIVKPDLLSGGITQQFISATHPVIEKLSNQELGSTVTGLYTNLPALMSPVSNSLRWFPELSDIFVKRWGYRIENYLPCLFETVGNWTKVRHDYYKTIQEIILMRWAIPWKDYSTQKKINWNSFDILNPDNDDYACLDKMSVFEFQQLPKICLSGMEFCLPASRANSIRLVKEASSAVDQLDLKHLIGDVFGDCDWNISFGQMKQIADASFVMGTNRLHHHVSYADITGNKKYSGQISFSSHNSWWSAYALMNNYFSRLSLLLSSGNQNNRILVIEPVSTAWMYYAVGKDNNYFKGLYSSFNTMLNFFERCHIEYDLGSESIIKNNARVNEDNIAINNCTYETIVFPPDLENIDSSTFELVKEYLKNGGKIMSFSSRVKYLEGAWSKELDELPDKYPESWMFEDNYYSIGVVEELISDDYQLLNPELAGGELYHIRRKLKDGYVLFLSNQSSLRKSEGTIKTYGQKVFCFNPMNGDITIYPSMKSFNNLFFDFSIDPGGSLLLYVGNEDISQLLSRGVLSTDTLDAAGSLNVKRLSENNLSVNKCRIEINHIISEEVPVKNALKTIHSMLSELNLPLIINGDTTYPSTKEDVNSLRIHYYFEADSLISTSIKLVFTLMLDYNIRLNDVYINPFTSSWWLDPDLSTLEVRNELKSGINEIVLEYKNNKIPASIEPVFIIGDFSLEPLINGFRIVPAGSLSMGPWKDNGLPLYTSAVSYIKQFRIKKDIESQYKISLGEWSGIVAMVSVNNRQAGIIGWKPYELDVTNYIKTGMNEIEVVLFGSLFNLINYLPPESNYLMPNKKPAEASAQMPGTMSAEGADDNFGLLDTFYLLESK